MRALLRAGAAELPAPLASEDGLEGSVDTDDRLEDRFVDEAKYWFPGAPSVNTEELVTGEGPGEDRELVRGQEGDGETGQDQAKGHDGDHGNSKAFPPKLPEKTRWVAISRRDMLTDERRVFLNNHILIPMFLFILFCLPAGVFPLCCTAVGVNLQKKFPILSGIDSGGVAGCSPADRVCDNGL